MVVEYHSAEINLV